jgi:hypothetical protein
MIESIVHALRGEREKYFLVICILHTIFAKSNACKTLWYFSMNIVKNKSIRKGKIWPCLYNKATNLGFPIYIEGDCYIPIASFVVVNRLPVE